VSGTFKRLTAGSGDEVDPSCLSGDVLTFTNVEAKSGIWSLPFDFGEGRSTGPLTAITPGPSGREPSVSKDGRLMAFVSAQSGPLNVWLRDLETGKESHLASSASAQRYPLANSTGSKVAFSAFEAASRSVYLWSADGTMEKLCEGCLRATDWSGDEKRLLVYAGSPYQIDSVDVASHQRTSVLKHGTYSLLYGRFSPDNLWVSFTARTGAGRGMIMIAPLDGSKAVPESAWVQVAEEGPEDRADWSPDGRTLYYTSVRDGHTCLWGQRMDTASRRPVGEAFPVQHFHGRLSYQQAGWSGAGGRIAVGLTDNRENIWMMSRTSSH
jgi:Tol biopolymer transport system component